MISTATPEIGRLTVSGAELIFHDIAASASKLPPRLPVTSWHGHIPFLYLLMRLLAPKVVVELGVHHGASFIAACDAARRELASCRLYGIDTWAGDPHTGFYEGDALFASLSEYINAQFPSAELIRSTFADARGRFNAGGVDLLHIDGLHSYEAVRADFETWRDTLSDRSVVLFHDTWMRERGFGVWRFWNEIKEIYSTFEFFHGYGLGVLFFGSNLPEALQHFIALLRTNPAFESLIRALFEEMGSSVPRRVFDRDQGLAYPNWEDYRTRTEAELARLRAENAELRRQHRNYETLCGEIRRLTARTR